MFNNGLNLKFDFQTNEFVYEEKTFGPKTEKRKLDDIRKSLKNPNCTGPDIVYSIAMDVGLKEDREDLIKRNLLYGACIYSNGTLEDEPVRSQGHIHAISKSCDYSTGELYEIWHGKAIIFMHEYAKYNPGRVFAVEANEGDVVLVPPNWAHYTANANSEELLVFGAWCIRDYSFEYEDVRAFNGLAYFPIVHGEKIEFIHNGKYENCELIRKAPRKYTELNLDYTKSIYEQYRDQRNRFDFITNPLKYKDLWVKFVP